MKAIVVILFTVILFFGNIYAQPDSVQKDDVFELTLSELMNLEVYTASKISQKATDAPATVYVITQEQIESRNYSCLEELLDDIPQIELQRKSISQSSDIFTINGVFGSEKFIILRNGIRINSSTGTAHTIGESYSLENVKQVEIILGPASALYGADAFTGIVNIITNEGYQNKGIHLNSSFGLYNTSTNTLNYNTGNKKISFSLTGKYYHSDEAFFPDFYPEDFAWYNHYAETGEMQIFGVGVVQPEIGIKPWGIPTNAYSVTADLFIKKFRLGYSRFYESHNNSVGSFPETNIYCKESSYLNHLQNIYVAHKYTSDNEKIILNTTISAQEFETHPETSYINQYSAFYNAFKYERNRTAKAEEDLTYSFSENFITGAGLSFEYINAIPITSDLPFMYDENKKPEEQNIYYPGTNFTDSAGNDLSIIQDIFNLNYYNFGSYLQFQYQIFKMLTLTAGSRFDYNSRYKSTFNPRIGLVFKPVNKITIKLLYGHSYLSPSPFKSYQHFGSFSPVYNQNNEITGLECYYFFLPNPDLEPEKRVSYDTYLMYQISENLALSLNTYYGEISNLISTTGTDTVTFHNVPVGWVETLTNQGNSTAYGGTFRVDFRRNLGIFFKINFFAAYTFSNGNISDNPLIYSAKHTVKTGIDLNFKNKINLYTKVAYRSGSHYIFSTFDTPVMNEPFTLINLTLNYNIVEKKKFKAGLYAEVSNLLNSKYYNVGENFGLTPQDPIRINFGVKITF